MPLAIMKQLCKITAGTSCELLRASIRITLSREQGSERMVSSIVKRVALSMMLGGLLTMVFIGNAQNFTDLKPSPQAAEWQDLEFGVLIHFGPNTFLGKEWGDGTASPSVFNPNQLDTGQWMRAIKSAGATYVVMVAKHHDGLPLAYEPNGLQREKQSVERLEGRHCRRGCRGGQKVWTEARNLPFALGPTRTAVQ